MSVSLSIMHASKRGDRRANVAALIRQMGGPTRLNEDTLHWEVTQDLDHLGPWRTARRALISSYKAQATHHILLQDDVILCDDFVPAVKELIELRPDAALSLFTPRPVVLDAKRRNTRWLRMPGGAWMQALVLPSPWIPEFIKWADTHVPPTYPHDDHRLSLWIMEFHKPSYGVAPTLADHGRLDSALGHTTRLYSKWFIGEKVSALSVDWSVGLANPVTSPAPHSLKRRWEMLEKHQAKVTSSARGSPDTTSHSPA